jgi:hypothetical protein
MINRDTSVTAGATTTARLLHPSVEQRCEPISMQVLRDIADGLASSNPAPTGSLGRGEIRRTRLLATTAYDAWLLELGPHAVIEPHDHEGSIGATSVIEGNVLELRTAEDGIVRSNLRQAGPGETIEVGITHRHLLMNAMTVPMRAVQTFSPPLGRD